MESDTGEVVPPQGSSTVLVALRAAYSQIFFLVRVNPGDYVAGVVCGLGKSAGMAVGQRVDDSI